MPQYALAEWHTEFTEPLRTQGTPKLSLHRLALLRTQTNSSLLRARGATVGHGTTIGPRLTVSQPRRLWIGDRTNLLAGAILLSRTLDGGPPGGGPIRIGSKVYIGLNAYVVSHTGITIGDDSVLSDHVYLNDGTHGLNPTAGHIMEQPVTSKGPIQIGNGVFIGYRALILPGVSVGAHSVVSAQSVVTADVPPFTMVAGSPARPIKRFDHESDRWIDA